MSSAFDPPLLYARCWEDDAVLRAGLRLGPGDDVLSIASAGDNSFALLLDDVKSVTLLDRNTTQLAICELKMAAIAQLEVDEARKLLGMAESNPLERHMLYHRLRPGLSGRARASLDPVPRQFGDGLLDAGKFERYLASFREYVLPLVQSRSTLEQMAALTDLGEQRRLFDSRWNTRRWRALFRLFFSKAVMSRRGRERAFFDHVEERSISDVFLGRAEKALTRIPVATNPYLVWILTGDNLMPPYLTDDGFYRIRERLDRLQLVEDGLGEHLASATAGRYSAFNLSDCFEYMSQDATDAQLRDVVRVSRTGARLVYWNLLVPRDGSNIPALRPETELAERLHAQDRAFFYGRLVVETVR